MRTTTLRVGTAVIVLPWHNPVLLAEQAATLDLVSGGRLDFGIGKGYRHSEFVRLPHSAGGSRRAVRGSARHHHQGVDVARAVLASRPVLAVRRHRGRAAAGAEAASAVLGRGRERRLDPARGAARLQPDPRPVRLAPEAIGERIALYRREREAHGLGFDPMQVAVARQLYVAHRIVPTPKLRWRGRPCTPSAPSTCRARPAARAARTFSPMRTPPAGPKPMRSTVRLMRSARSLRRLSGPEPNMSC